MAAVAVGPACSLKVLPKSTSSLLGKKLIHKCYTNKIVPYSIGTKIMDQTVRSFLDYKLQHPDSRNIYSENENLTSSSSSPPIATLLTFQFEPTYTLGRREKGKLSKESIFEMSNNGDAKVVETLRGGQTTFHGPGQLVAYPIIDLRSFETSSSSNNNNNNENKLGLPIRCYVELLERTVIKLLTQKYGLSTAQITENTGVWMDNDHKICAIGVHVRRYITSHGIGLNVSTDTKWFDRIVACGLPDKHATSILKELEIQKNLQDQSRLHGQLNQSNIIKNNNNNNPSVTNVASEFAHEFADSLGLSLEEEFL